jgi:hypothetical protein
VLRRRHLWAELAEAFLVEKTLVWLNGKYFPLM